MIKNIFIVLLVLVVSVLGADNQAGKWKASGRLNAYIQSIDIRGEGNNTKEGTTHVEVLNLNFSGPLKDGKAGVEMRMRTTNDDGVQKDRAELLYLHSYFRNKIWTIEKLVM